MRVIILSAIKDETYSLNTEYEINHTGVGKVNAALSTLRTIKEDKPDLIINFGTAGSLNSNISGLIDCKYFIQRDMDSRPLGTELGQTPFEEDPPKIIEIEDHPINTINMNLICATGDSFVESNIGLKADVVDMEAYAIAKVCYQESIPFACFKYISDFADKGAANDSSENVRKAGKVFTEDLNDKSI
jgi:adenosylhomocysteine nucleosidase